MSRDDRTGLRRYAQLARISPARRERLAAAGELDPNSTFSRKGRRGLPDTVWLGPSRTGPDPATVALVLKRALRWVDGQGLVPCCEVCAEPVWGARGLDWSLHHRRGRMGVRTDNSPANLIVCCGASNMDGCHGRVHQRRSWSQPLGLWLPRNGVPVAPALVPVTVDRESRVVYLTAGGGYADNPPMGGSG